MAASNLLLFRLAEFLRGRKEAIVADTASLLRRETDGAAEIPWSKWVGRLVQDTSDRLMARAAMVENAEGEETADAEEEPQPEGIERILGEGPMVRTIFTRVLNRFQSEQAERHDFTPLEMTEARQDTLHEFDRLTAATMARWIKRDFGRTEALDPHAISAVHDGLKGVLGLLQLALGKVPASSRVHLAAAVQQLARLTTRLGEASGANGELAFAPAAEEPAPAAALASAPLPPPAIREPLRLAPLHVSSFVRTLTEAFRPAAESKGLRFETRCSPAPEIIHTDAAKLHQAASLILDHAVSHTTTGRIVMTAGLLTGDRWSLGVRDTGPTLSPEILSTVQLGLSAAGPAASDGALNIAIARDLADLLGGHLEADSRPDEGTHFRLTLPLN